MKTVVRIDGRALRWRRSRSYADAPKKGGVYALFTETGECLYVGQAQNLYLRLRLHQTSNVFYRILTGRGEQFHWWYTAPRYEGYEVEIAAALRPRLNTPQGTVKVAQTFLERSTSQKQHANRWYAERKKMRFEAGNIASNARRPSRRPPPMKGLNDDAAP